ncbi:unnamed protein product, partial [Phaeothamnion confervicola]
MGGEVVVLGTGIRHDPENAWPSAPRGPLNGFVHGAEAGVFIRGLASGVAGSRYAAVVAARMPLRFEIVDRRATAATAAPLLPPWQNHYHVVVTARASSDLGGDDGAGGVLLRRMYDEPGEYVVDVAWRRPRRTTLTVTLTTGHGLVFTDSVEIGYNVGFHAVLKWMVRRLMGTAVNGCAVQG